MANNVNEVLIQFCVIMWAAFYQINVSERPFSSFKQRNETNFSIFTVR